MAVGDSAVSHSRRMYGDRYAEEVTKSYVEAAGLLVGLINGHYI